MPIWIQNQQVIKVKNSITLPKHKTSCFEKYLYYEEIKMYNALLKNLQEEQNMSHTKEWWINIPIQNLFSSTKDFYKNLNWFIFCISMWKYLYLWLVNNIHNNWTFCMITRQKNWLVPFLPHLVSDRKAGGISLCLHKPFNLSVLI